MFDFYSFLHDNLYIVLWILIYKYVIICKQQSGMISELYETSCKRSYQHEPEKKETWLLGNRVREW